MNRAHRLLAMGMLLGACNRSPAPAAGPSGAAPVLTPSPAESADDSLPAPRHGGTVQRVGNYALETVAARSGGVALFWSDLDGNPVPPAQIELQSVHVNVGGRLRIVPVRAVNGAYVGRVSIPTAAPIAVTVPRVVILGAPYTQIAVPTVVVVAALPTFIIVPAAPVIVIGKHRKFRKFRGGFSWH